LAANNDLKREEYDFRTSDQGIEFSKWRDNQWMHCQIIMTQTINVEDSTKADVHGLTTNKDYNSQIRVKRTDSAAAL
jgi:hypothetical protein